jgi:ATP-dependent HslUV protease ATP-binding subunit HslU
VRNRWRRSSFPSRCARTCAQEHPHDRPTGVGKTEIARRLAGLTGAPFIKVEATKYTEVGYHGRDVESMIRDLLDSSIQMVREEMTESVKEPAEKHVEDDSSTTLLPTGVALQCPSEDEERNPTTREAQAHARKAPRAASRRRAGRPHDRRSPSKSAPPSSACSAGGHGDGRRVPEHVREDAADQARDAPAAVATRASLCSQEAEKLIDKDKIHRTAIERVEQSGHRLPRRARQDRRPRIQARPDVSRRACSAICCRSSRAARCRPSTAGQNRPHPVHRRRRVSQQQAERPDAGIAGPLSRSASSLQDLTKETSSAILREPKNALTRQQIELLQTEGVEVTFTDDAIDAMAQIAYDVNRRTQNIGAAGSTRSWNGCSKPSASRPPT